MNTRSILAIVILFSTFTAHAAESRGFPGHLLRDLQRMTGHEMAADIKMRRLTSVEIAETCNCNGARSLFMQGVVLLDSSIDLDTKQGQGILFHEMVHAVQWSQHGDPIGCEEWLRRETQAQQTERAWLSQHNVRLPLVLPYQCDE